MVDISLDCFLHEYSSTTCTTGETLIPRFPKLDDFPALNAGFARKIYCNPLLMRQINVPVTLFRNKNRDFQVPDMLLLFLKSQSEIIKNIHFNLASSKLKGFLP
jgi:hypothetical protein